jgi:hypothetical protein
LPFFRRRPVSSRPATPYSELRRRRADSPSCPRHSMTVLILGGMDDAHACHVLEHLRFAGTDAELLDGRWFPSALQLAYDPAAERGTIRLPAGRLLKFEQITAVYWRCYNPVAVANLPDPEQAYIATNDARGLFESLLIRLPARWVNGWRAYQLHQTKPVQLAMVAALGVPVPATLLANDPEAVRDFAARHPHCVFKPVQGGAHTRRLTSDHLSDDNLRNLALAPVTIQEEVPGRLARLPRRQRGPHREARPARGRGRVVSDRGAGAGVGVDGHRPAADAGGALRLSGGEPEPDVHGVRVAERPAADGRADGAADRWG